MNAKVQVELIKKVVKDWALSDDCSGVDAMIAIMEILDYNPYDEQRQQFERLMSTNEQASAVSGG